MDLIMRISRIELQCRILSIWYYPNIKDCLSCQWVTPMDKEIDCHLQVLVSYGLQYHLGVSISAFTTKIKWDLHPSILETYKTVHSGYIAQPCFIRRLEFFSPSSKRGHI